jgi:8-oxo-dGTP diphosphatase
VPRCSTRCAALTAVARGAAGIDIPLDALTVRCMQHRPSGAREYLDFYVAASAWQGEPRNCEPHKCAEVAWFPSDALPAQTLDYVRAALATARGGGTPFTSWGWPARAA